MRKWLLLPAILLSAALLTAGVREWRRRPDGRVHIAFLDVGQGDSALIITPSGRHIVIDGGPDLTTLRQVGQRLPFFSRTIDLLILSHPNSDHLASFPEILERYHVGAVLLAGSPYTLARYDRILSDIRRQHIPVILADAHKTINIGDSMTAEILWPLSDEDVLSAKDVNDASAVVRISYGNHTALFTGDIGAKTEKAILNTNEDIRSDVLKVAHHGSKYSTSTGFLLAVDPKLVIISAGKDNGYGHPSPVITNRLEHFNIPYKRTDRDGTIEVVWW